MAIDQRNDQRNISSTLRMMSTDALRKYGELHKSDPFIFPLVFQESQDRQHARSAQQMQGGQAQPKVVDQALAQMAPQPGPQQMAQAMPEDQGIAQIPAGNMNFAGGGIIAFADGGDVERYQSGGAIAAKYQQESQEMGMGMRRQYSPDVQAYAQMQSQPSADEQQMFKDEQQRMLSGGRFNAFPVLPTVDAPPATAAPVTPAAPPRPTAAQGAPTAPPVSTADMAARASASPYVSATPKNAEEAAMLERYAPTTKAAATDKVAPTARPPAARPGAGLEDAAAAKNAAATGPTDIEALQQKYFGQIDQEVGGLRNARAGLVAGIKDLTAQNLAATKAGIEQRGDVFKGREERLAKQEKGLEGMGDKYMGLALLQAGAAMMTTPGGIGAALGKGIDTGSKQYAMGMEKINAAKDKFADARDRLDDLRINRDDMNAKDIRAAEKEARESGLKGQELLYNGLVSDLGIKQKNVTAIFGAAADDLKTTRTIAAERENTLTRERGAGARNAATIAAQLNTPDRLVFDQLVKDNQGNPVKAAEALQKLKAEKFNMYEAYSKYLTGFAGKETVTPPQSFDQFASQFAIPTTKTPGKGATVLKQP